MKPQKLRDAYNRCCDLKAFPPSAGQLEEWHKQLGHLESEDLEWAITEWFRKNIDFPMPAPLRELAAQHQRGRIAKTREHQVLVQLDCPACGCWHSTVARPGAVVQIRCGRCGARITATAKEAA